MLSKVAENFFRNTMLAAFFGVRRHVTLFKAIGDPNKCFADRQRKTNCDNHTVRPGDSGPRIYRFLRKASGFNGDCPCRLAPNVSYQGLRTPFVDERIKNK